MGVGTATPGEMCDAAIFRGDGTVEVRSFTAPTPPPGGAVLRVEAVGLCGSDISQLHGHHHVPGEVSPVVPGHEIVARVHALAPDAQLGVEVGQRVAVDLVVRCGACAQCTFGSPLCENMRLYGYSFPLTERSGLYGGYGELMEVTAGTHLLALTDAVSAEELTLFEPLANAVNWLSSAQVGPGTSVVVLGPGHMGLTCAALALAWGASPVIVTGTSRDGRRLEAARQLGCTATVDVEAEDAMEVVRAHTAGAMADVVVDLTDADDAVQVTLELVRFGGTVVWAGLKRMRPVPVVSDLVPLRALTVIGASGSTARSMETAVDLLNAGRIPTRALVGETFTLAEIDRALELLARADPGHDALRVGLVHR